jgi:hypothetical protein
MPCALIQLYLHLLLGDAFLDPLAEAGVACRPPTPLTVLPQTAQYNCLLTLFGSAVTASQVRLTGWLLFLEAKSSMCYRPSFPTSKVCQLSYCRAVSTSCLWVSSFLQLLEPQTRHLLWAFSFHQAFTHLSPWTVDSASKMTGCFLSFSSPKGP